MTASVKREELHAFSDGAALLGVGVCAAIGFAWAVGGKDPGMVLAGSILTVAAAMSGVYLLDRFRGKATPVDDTGYADGVVRAGVIAAVFWGIAGFLVGDLIAWQLAYPILNLDLEWTSFGRLRPLHTSAVIFAFGGNVADRKLILCRAAHQPRASGGTLVALVRVLGLPALHRACRHRLSDRRHPIERICRA